MMKNGSIKLSIIVPAYNNEKYLIECLDSIKNQNLENYECIIIDDGSKDNTGKICDEYVSKNPQFTVIHQENSGVSSARNKGIDSATGDYITFVDSDDLISADTYKNAIDTIIQKECDVYCFGVAKYTNNKDISLYDFKTDNLQKMYMKYPVYMNSVCNKVFNLKLLRENNIHFDSEIITSEDLLVSFKALSLSKKTVFTNNPDYLYRDNENSVTHLYCNITSKEARSKEVAAITQNLQSFYENHDVKAKELINYLQLRDALSYIEDYDFFYPKEYKKYAAGIKLWTFDFSIKRFYFSFMMSFNLIFMVYFFHFLQGIKKKLSIKSFFKTIKHLLGKIVPMSIKDPINHIIENPKLVSYYFNTKKSSKKNQLKLKTENKRFSKSLAIQIHIFYPELLEEIYSYLKNISFKYDLYITTDTLEKKEQIESFFSKNPLDSVHYYVAQVENRGRDIWPFLFQMHPVYKNYDYIIHLHTKKSFHSNKGDKWRKYLYKHILGKKNHLEKILLCAEDNKDFGFISPAPFMKVIKSYYDNIHNDEYNKMIDELLDRLNINIDRATIKEQKFPSGNMFIAKTDAIRQLLEYPFTSKDFPDELGQVNGTLQHIIEFFWIYIVTFNGYQYKECK